MTTNATATTKRSPRAVAKKLNDHHARKAAGFYAATQAAGAGRYFGARVRAGKLQVTPDFEDWQTIEDLDGAEYNDGNGRRIFI